MDNDYLNSLVEEIGSYDCYPITDRGVFKSSSEIDKYEASLKYLIDKGICEANPFDKNTILLTILGKRIYSNGGYIAYLERSLNTTNVTKDPAQYDKKTVLEKLWKITNHSIVASIIITVLGLIISYIAKRYFNVTY